MARKTRVHRRSHKRSHKSHKRTHRRKTHRRRQTRKRGGACPCAASNLLRGGYRGYTTGAAATLSQMNGNTPGLSSGGNRRSRRNRNNNAPPFVQNIRNQVEMNQLLGEINETRRRNMPANNSH
jgi:hypothetical protein